MNFQDLHELLRLELLRRIERGMLTGSRLAQQTGFQQAHISNFLNRKRALSLEGLDRVLAAQDLTVDQILPIEITAATSPASTNPIETVPIVSASTAIEQPRIASADVIESLHVSASRLADNRARPSPRNVNWQRFVGVRSDAQQAAAMDPILAPGTIAVIDRHYNSLAPYRAHQPNLYAVRNGTTLQLRYLDFEDSRLILRPTSIACPIQLLALASHETPADYIVGRVCLLFYEL